MLSTLGPSVRTVFRSRWRALWWSAGVLLTAYCAVPSPDHDKNEQAQTAQPSSAHANPWAKDTAK